MGSANDTPSLVYPPPLDPARPNGDAQSLVYPPPLDPARTTGGLQNGMTDASGTEPPTIELSAPILVVGGGPVGMLTALLLSRLHSLHTILLERAPTTTLFPKMEFTSGRSMEIYRALCLSSSLRAMATQSVPESARNDELILTSLLPSGRLLHSWPHDSAEVQRKKGSVGVGNDGSAYLEPHMRCHQIDVERWLKEQVVREELIDSHWGVGFVGLSEEEGGDEVVSEARRESDGAKIRVRSKYVIGCDGGGSWVRKSVGLESKRNYLPMQRNAGPPSPSREQKATVSADKSRVSRELTMAFAHFRSAALRASIDAHIPRFWHANTVGGGILVSQNENDLWTAHYMVPPGVDPAAIPAEEIILRSVSGCQEPSEDEKAGLLAVDEVYCKGLWKVEVAIADAFRSERGRVLLVGDAAHQLSPVGGHGLNSGIGDAFDLAWKIAAVEKGWGGKGLLGAYDGERRQVAFENLGHVQQALGEVAMPMFGAHMKYGAEVLVGEGKESEKARRELGEVLERGKWLHDQNGNILGVRYKRSEILVEDGETGEPPASTNDVYVPSTWSGARAPHVWMQKGGSTLDELSVTGFNIIDFSPDGELSRTFIAAAEVLAVPLKVLRWHGEEHVRKIYERDVVLVRPDMYVAWRGKAGDSQPVSDEYARAVLSKVIGQGA